LQQSGPATIFLWRFVTLNDVAGEPDRRTINTCAFYYKRERNVSVFFEAGTNLSTLRARWPTKGLAEFTRGDADDLEFTLVRIEQDVALGDHAHLQAPTEWSNGMYKARAAELARRSRLLFEPTK